MPEKLFGSIDKKSKEYKKKYIFLAAGLYKNRIYFIRHASRDFMYLDLIDKKMRYIIPPDNLNIAGWATPNHIIVEEDKIYIKEHFGKQLIEYSVDDNKSRQIDLPKLKEEKMYSVYSFMTKFKEWIYLFSRTANSIVKVNLESREIDIDTMIESVPDGEEICIQCGCKIMDYVWLFSQCGKMVLKYDLKGGTKEVFALPEEIRGCIDAVYAENRFFILNMTDDVYTWSPEDNSIEKIIDFDKKTEERQLVRVIHTKRKIILLSGTDGKIYSFNIKSRKLEQYEDYPENFRELDSDQQHSKYYYYVEDKNYFYFSMQYYNMLLVINKDNGECKWIAPKMPTRMDEIQYYEKMNGGIFDDENCSIEDMMLLYDVKEKRHKNSVFSTKNIGKLICDRMNS